MAKQGPLSGRQIANKYQLDELLGSGGMGAVYKAQDTRLNRPVAMKVMSPAGRVSAANLQHFTKLFQAEALRLASLKHPSIPHIYDHFEEAAHWFLVMEFIEGETLKDYQQRHGGQLQVDEVLKIGLQLADVLHYLHLRQPPIIFRDLKPANVMIAPDGQVTLIDFGIARLFTPGKSQDTFVFLSPGYAAPEQHGTAQTTLRSDIYSLGATLHHLLSGIHPATSPFLFAPLSTQQSAQLASLITHMVAIDPANRPASMVEVKAALQSMRDQKEKAKLLLERGDSFYEVGKYSEALAAYEAAFELEPTLEPTKGLAFLQKALALDDLEREEEANLAYEEEARLAYKEAIKLEPVIGYLFGPYSSDMHIFEDYGPAERWDLIHKYARALETSPTKTPKDIENQVRRRRENIRGSTSRNTDLTKGELDV